MSFMATASIGNASQNAYGSILYGGIFEQEVTLSALNYIDGFPPENAVDGLTYDSWAISEDSWIKAESEQTKVANCVGFYAVKSNQDASFSVQFSDDGITWQIARDRAPLNDGANFYTFSDKISKYWRIYIWTEEDVYIGGLILSQVMNLELGLPPNFASPFYNRKIETKTYKSDAGQYISGTILRKGIEGSIRIINLTERFIYSKWIPFVDYVQEFQRPFLFSWDPINHSNEVVLCYVKNDIDAPRWQSKNYLSASIDFEGQR